MNISNFSAFGSFGVTRLALLIDVRHRLAPRWNGRLDRSPVTRRGKLTEKM
jgi:hypothetical protein